MRTALFRTAVVLGLVSAIGPFAIDMYLPALPSIGHSLGVGPAAVQLTLTSFFLSLGFGQLVYGPAADMFGRKAPLYFGVIMFAVASVGCALSTSVEMLIAFRFFQGFGGSVGMVVPRAIVRDMHTGVDAARLMSLLLLVFSVSPILAPLVGSFLVEWQGWRAVFWCVFVASMLSLVLLRFRLKETRPHHERASSTIGSALRAYRELLGDWRFLGLTFTGAFGMSSFFSYLSNSSFLVMEHYHHSARAFSVIFGVNAFAFIAASQGAGALISRFGMARVVRTSVWGYCLCMLALLAVFMAGVDRLDVLVAFLFVGFGFLGLVIPTSSVMALEEHGAIAGTASALLGTLQFAVGALVMTLTAPFGNASARPMVTSIAIVSVISLILAMLSVRDESPADASRGIEQI